MTNGNQILDEAISKWREEMYLAFKRALEEQRTVEPCDDAISRRAVLKLFATHDGKYLFEAIRYLPSVTPKQRTGHWIPATRPFNFRFKCSECGRPALKSERSGNDVRSKYCPRCGARMESEEQE